MDAEERDRLLALATDLAEEHEIMLTRLIQAREHAGLSQRDIAKLIGVSQPTIAAFERHDNDPKLSTIRRYALAVGALIEHRVTVGGEPVGEVSARPSSSDAAG